MVTSIIDLLNGNLVTAMALKMRRNRSPEPPEPCMLTECMAVIAGAWAPNVIWSLRAGPRRFSELRADIPPISAKVLSARLSELEERGVLIRHVRRTSPPSTEYELTPLGLELIPALDAIVQVGHRLKALQSSSYG
ncbi:winged helix-turn-helix transcriptional regulator [Citromicrobium sp. JL1351]